MEQMKTAIKYSKLIGLFGMLVGILMIGESCSKGDDSEIENEPVPSLAFSVDLELDENPKEGDVLGKVSSTLPGDLTYTVSTQTPEGALLVVPKTGEIIIANPSKFDYESAKNIQANIFVTNGTASENGSVTILVKDLDDILSFLVDTDSKEKYINENKPGAWIQITKEDYESLAKNLNEVTRTGLDEGVYDTPSENLVPISQKATYVNNQQPLMPTGSLLFAFKYKAIGDSPQGCGQRAKVKLADGQNDPTFNDLGDWLPCHTNGEVFFLYVGEKSATINEGSIAFYTDFDIQSTKSDPNQNSTAIGGDRSAVSVDAGGNIFSRAMQYQGLSTTQIQWHK